MRQMHLCLGEGAGNAEDEAFAVVPADPDGDEGGAVPDVAVDPHLVVGGVGEEVGDLSKGAVLNGLSLSRTRGMARPRAPVEVRKVRGLKPLA